jgi:hypothetical protein
VEGSDTLAVDSFELIDALLDPTGIGPEKFTLAP